MAPEVAEEGLPRRQLASRKSFVGQYSLRDITNRELTTHLNLCLPLQERRAGWRQK